MLSFFSSFDPLTPLEVAAGTVTILKMRKSRHREALQGTRRSDQFAARPFPKMTSQFCSAPGGQEANGKNTPVSIIYPPIQVVLLEKTVAPLRAPPRESTPLGTTLGSWSQGHPAPGLPWRGPHFPKLLSGHARNQECLVQTRNPDDVPGGCAVSVTAETVW